MPTRVSSAPVVDRSKYPKRLVYLDKEGYVAIADRIEPMSDEEKAKRTAARKQKHNAVIKDRAEKRSAMRAAKLKAKMSLSIEDAQEYEAALKAYEVAMGRLKPKSN